MSTTELKFEKKTHHRTHSCGELTKKNVGSKVTLSGWVHRKRDHGGVYFIDLRDHYGITQIVTTEHDDRMHQLSKKDYDRLISIGYESVISIHGTVVERDNENINQDMFTGEIEVVVERFNIESEAQSLPINVNAEYGFPEELRLKYRFLDLRHERMQKNIILRNSIISYIRKAMWDRGFMEFNTPILTASSPEGARDFIVPSRMHPGNFFALPQAPQQFKQLLMISGFDRYFQIAPCFRDEDARADRAPGEFYQLDMEMSFVSQEDVFKTIEPVIHGVFKEFSKGFAVTEAPFPRIPYHEAMLKYGSDKPDLRIPIAISDVTHLFKNSNFTIFKKAIEKGSIVRAIPAPKASSKSRSFFDKMIEYAQKSCGARGLGYINFDEENNPKGPVAKFLNEHQISEIQKITKMNAGDAVFFSCDAENTAASIAGKVRVKLGEELNIINQKEYKLCWIVDYPMYEYDEENKKLDFSHNPFSMPQGGLEALQKAKTLEEKLSLKAWQYDIVCNGIELSSGAIRNHNLDIMYKAFELVGYSKEDVNKDFAGMVKALSYGAPPHGGIAPGIDRIVMMLANEPNIREVICFPLTQNGQDLLMGAPSPATQTHLDELSIAVLKKEEEEEE